MSKFKMGLGKINFSKIGNGIANILWTNSGILIGGATMIGLALLCKKLDIPYQVLTDPFYVTTGTTKTGKTQKTYPILTEVQWPRDSTEEAIEAITAGALEATFDSERQRAADDIYDILSATYSNTGMVNEHLKSYAISQLRKISSGMTFDSGKRAVTGVISKIVKEDF